MPDRKCEGCKKQVQWGCTAKAHAIFNEFTGEPEIDKFTKLPKVVWSNPARIPEVFDGEETFACPRQTLHENPREWNKLLMFFSMFKEGFLPQRGAVVDQSNKAIEVLNILNTVNQECDDDLAAQARTKANGNPYGRMG